MLSGPVLALPIYTVSYLLLLAVLSGDRRANAGGDKTYEPESTYNDDMPVERLLDAEMAVEPINTQYVDSSVSLLVGYPTRLKLNK